MTAYSSALRLLERELGPGSAAAFVRRTEVGKDAALTFTLDFDGRQRWFRAVDAALFELFPHEEVAVPCAVEVSRLVRAKRGEILSWRPGRRIVARIDTLAGLEIVKGFRENRSGPAMRAHETFAGLRTSADFRVARLLQHDAAAERLRFELLRGRPLDFEPRRDPLQASFVAIGERLARLQALQPAEALPPHTRSAECALLDRAAHAFERVAGRLPPGWKPTRRRLDKRLDRAQAETVLVHRDLHDGQLLVQEDGIALLDLDLFSRGESALDPSNLIAHFHLCALQGLRGATAARAARAEDALQQGLARGGRHIRREDLDWYRSATALRLALIYGLRPRWSHLSPALVDLAADWAEVARGD